MIRIVPGDTYLGDGLYAEFTGEGIILKAERVENILSGPTIHYVVLEPAVLEALIQFAIKVGWLNKPESLDT